MQQSIDRPTARHGRDVTIRDIERTSKLEHLMRENRSSYPMNVQVDKPTHTVRWNCPDCNHQNDQIWYGREFHFCLNCGQAFDIKG